jgi:hypothetical protein
MPNKEQNLTQAFRSRSTCGLYCKLSTIVNDDSSIINKFEASLTDAARVVIYNHHRFIVQATVFTPCTYFRSLAKWSNLEFKTLTKQVSGYLPLDIGLFGAIYLNITFHV